KDHLLGLVIDGKLMPDDRAGAEAEARSFLERAEAPEAGAEAEARSFLERAEAPEAGAVPGAVPPPAGPELLAPDPVSEAEQPARSPDGKREARAVTRRRSRSALPGDAAPDAMPQDRTLASTQTAARSRDSNFRSPAAHAAQGKRQNGRFPAETATDAAGRAGQEHASQRNDER
ncbi:MAG TPA: hypothetical protein VKT52_04475, partial [Ktedonobacterales bacterium]|nr:hypothetical protein [Ktedonobacterales bacterium]